MNDVTGMANLYSLRTRLLAQEGRAVEACTIEPPCAAIEPGAYGETLVSRGLALACVGRFDEALDLEQRANATTGAIEAKVLGSGIMAVSAVEQRRPGMGRAAASLVDKAFESGAIDLLVTCYRSSVHLLDVLVSSPLTSERTVYAITRARDGHLVEQLGHPPLSVIDARELLSRREKEVYELLCRGFSNREIATQLFICESTVKVHIRHIYDKLGTRSRIGLALSEATRTC